MDIRQFRYFVAIVEERSFTRAAARLNIAQPSLSLHVRHMEEEAGVRLLHRGSAGVVPTEAGDLLFRRASSVIEEFDRTIDDLRSSGQETRGTVRIGLPATIGGILGVPLIAACRARYPGVRIVIAEAMSGFVLDWLMEEKVDLGVVYSDARDSGVHAQALLDEELVLVLSDTSRTGHDTLDTLRRNPLILPSKSHGLRTLLERELSRRGVSIVPAIEIDSYANIKQLVATGYGCSILPRHAVLREIAAGELRVRQFAEPRLQRRAHLAHGARRPLSRAATAVHDTIRMLAVDLIKRGLWAGARSIAPSPHRDSRPSSSGGPQH